MKSWGSLHRWCTAATIFPTRLMEVRPLPALLQERPPVHFCSVRATVYDVEKVSDAGAKMPEKSTYFYPKLQTGLLINPLD